MTPEIDHLGKMSTVPRVSTHIYGVFQEIDGKMFIFRVNLGMWPLKSIVLEKWALFQGFQHTFMVFLKDIGGKTFIFQTKPRHVTPQIDRLGKMSTVPMVSTHIYGDSPRREMGKSFIFRVNRGMWPLKLINSEKWALVLRVPTHIYGVSQGHR